MEAIISEQVKLILAGAVLFAIVVLVFYQRLFKSPKRLLKPLAEALGGELDIGILELSNCVRLYEEGVEYRICIRPGVQWNPTLLVLQRMTSIGFDLAIYKEGLGTRALVAVGLQDIEIGDALFDEKYLINSSEPAKAQYFLQDQDRRRALNYFFSKGFSAVKADLNSLMIVKKCNKIIGPRIEDLDPKLIRVQLAQLQKLVGK